MLKINTVCVNGMGSSLILRMTVEKALKDLGIEARVQAVDLGGFKGLKPDICITTPELEKSIEKQSQMTILTITNFTDVNFIKGKIVTLLDQNKALSDKAGR